MDALPAPLLALVRELAGPVAAGVPLTAALPLVGGPLGMDSVRLVELLLRCEDAFLVHLDADALLATPLTLGSLAAALRDAPPL
ncbi:MAG: acyl carrier protein [Deltaproteobacteria bacterium]|nr:acyl carrier protein [Deltaproteobacteria bacterium]